MFVSTQATDEAGPRYTDDGDVVWMLCWENEDESLTEVGAYVGTSAPKEMKDDFLATGNASTTSSTRLRELTQDDPFFARNADSDPSGGVWA